MKTIVIITITGLLLFACKSTSKKPVNEMIKAKTEQYAKFKLQTDLSALSNNDKDMLRLFFKAADIMNNLFWIQAYGDKSKLLDTITDPYEKKFIEYNYGPWDRLDDNKPFIPGVGEKPKGANFYPPDMTTKEFKALADTTKNSQYTMLRKDDKGKLVCIPYHEFFKAQLTEAAGYIKKAADLCENKELKHYLELRADALVTDNYRPSDMAWMDMKSNILDFVIGPIETYEDKLFGYKASYEAYILIKDRSWSDRLDKYASLLPMLQKKLPVDARYKAESPGSSSDLGAYDVLYYAGDCNAGGKTIAINLPNDEVVQLAKGSRRLQLKNAMKAKFDKIMVPISNLLFVPEQRSNITFNAFFQNVMFHEVAHGLGIKNTITGKGTVREALKEQYSALEEGKADILGVFLINELINMKELDANIKDNYVTFMAGIFRSIRFGASDAHGRANLIRFNYFREHGAFNRNAEGLYSVNFEKMKEAIESLSRKIITIQGDGDYDAAKKMVEKYGVITPDLKEDLQKINKHGIPVDIVFEQGPAIAGL